MNIDQVLVIGLLICVLAIPSLLSAYADSRPPRAGAIMIFIGGVLLVVALTQKPGGYTLDKIPHVIMQVIGDLLR